MEDSPFSAYRALFFFGCSDEELRQASAAAARESPFLTWPEMCLYYGNRCLRCGKRTGLLTRDHVIPRSLGGPNSLANYQPLCGPCNRLKGNSVIDYRGRPHPLVRRFLDAHRK